MLGKSAHLVNCEEKAAGEIGHHFHLTVHANSPADFELVKQILWNEIIFSQSLGHGAIPF